jgi:DNA repair protein RadA/Sms
LPFPPIASISAKSALSGAIRPVAHAQQRLKEAEKLGFGQAVLPKSGEDTAVGMSAGLFQPDTLADLVARIAGSKRSGAQVCD